jgi:hydrogenase nickel incorporation protein HypA/HybF
VHEYGVTKRIVNIAVDAAVKQGAAKISRINLVIGEQSGFVGDSIQMYFNMLSKGTLAEGAELAIKYVKPRLICPHCGASFEKQPQSFDCPKCAAQGEPSPIGKEFYVDSIEVVE